MNNPILLASNACKNIYGDTNKANHFYTALPNEIVLPDNYGVALREITYSFDWPTVVDEFIELEGNTIENPVSVAAGVNLLFRKGGQITQSGLFGIEGDDVHFYYRTSIKKNMV